MLVNNAGKSIRRSIFDSLDRPHDFERTIKLNYLVPVKLSLAFLPDILEKKGQIVNVSSITALLFPPAKWAAYYASKTAYAKWCMSVDAEIRRKGVRCIQIFFSLVQTRMIIPTKAYRKMPALSSKQAAIIIARSMIKNKSYQPWWSGFAKIFSYFFEKLLTRLSVKF